MWRVMLNFTIVAMIYEVSGKLTGDHICEIEEKYMENVTEYYLDDITLRNYKWCMSIPPRCSDYTTKKVNKTRIVEKESTRLVEKCCPGFERNQNNTFCVPICPTCINGTCELGKCTCFAGFKGDKCDTGCEQTEWGPNCKFKCTCERGICHSTTGSCICPSGWTGNQCQDTCPRGFYGDGCLQECHCATTEACNVNGECISVSTESSSPLLLTTSSLPTTNIQIEESTTSNNVIVFENNGKLSNDIKIEHNPKLSTPLPILVRTNNEEFDKFRHQEMVKLPSISSTFQGHHGHQMKDSVDTEEGSYINKTFERSSSNEVIAKAKDQIEVAEDFLSLASTTTDCNNCDHHDDNDDAKFDPLSDVKKRIVVDYDGRVFQKKSIFSFFDNEFALAGMVIAVIVISMPVIAVVRIMRNRKKILSAQSHQKKSGNGSGTSGTSPFTQNIFDTPLPELPSPQDPFTESEIQVEESSFGPLPVVRHTTFQVQPTDLREYLYDHPPSTGSYRAVSIPEPPEIDDIGSVQSAPHSEPVYDEIPSGQLPQPVSAQHPLLFPSSARTDPQSPAPSLYMNTCAKTRL